LKVFELNLELTVQIPLAGFGPHRRYEAGMPFDKSAPARQRKGTSHCQ